MVSSSSQSRSEESDLSIDVTVKFLFFKKNIHYETHDFNSSFQGSVKVIGFDSLESHNCSESGSGPVEYARLRSIAEQNLQLGSSMETRIRQRMDSVALKDRCVVTRERCGLLFERGLVAEIVFFPFSRHRDYVQARLARP